MLAEKKHLFVYEIAVFLKPQPAIQTSTYNNEASILTKEQNYSHVKEQKLWMTASSYTVRKKYFNILFCEMKSQKRTGSGPLFPKGMKNKWVKTGRKVPQL